MCNMTFNISCVFALADCDVKKQEEYVELKECLLWR